MHPDESGPVDPAPVLNWQDGSTLRWTDRPEEVDAAFSRGGPLVGVAVMALALNHADADAILPRVGKALEAKDPEVRRQGVIALAAPLRGAVDPVVPEQMAGLTLQRQAAGADTATA
ncbi:hypothetical protein HXS80_18090 [Streptomyces sp. CB04723]|uniref:hypothetical protein n=1 Tax=Streptomyces TaxID=1883 RepID=UPI0015C447F1|nr:hypothetical protein [Streptomyces sp. CB04723]QLG33382.1 hypothetical protein HXS80_18090 [Streptomyces sp. CB04723]